MKKLTCILLIFAALAATAQDVKQIAYTVHTVQFAELQAPARRSNDGEIPKYLKAGGKNFEIANTLMKLERSLVDAEAYIKTGTKQINWLPHMYTLLSQVLKTDTKFDVSEYSQEIRLYEAYNKILATQEKQRFVRADSLKKAGIWISEKEQQKADSIARIKTQKQDSINKAYESYSKALLAGEQKAYKDVCIKKYGALFGPLVADRMVTAGMTKAMCLEAWGEPTSRKPVTENGITMEVWNYGPSEWLKFKNDELVATSQKK
jgi:hypothetical protein